MQHRFALFIRSSLAGMTLALLLATPGSLEAQEGFLPGNDEVRPWGQGVTPMFEGFYEHPDGEGMVISFGYLNRNSEEVLDIPVGPNNNIEPDSLNGVQPTHFLPRRQYGVFTVTVPEDFGRNDIVWTLSANGESYSIPGRIVNNNYLIDAMYAPATGLTPPTIAFDPDGAEGKGPHGIQAEPRTVEVGQPLELSVWTRDDTWGNDESDDLEPHEVTLRWYWFRGPGEVTFSQERIPVEPQEEGLGETTTTATFSEPGEYVLYVRANNEPVVSAGMEQCCWTNGYVNVTVTP